MNIDLTTIEAMHTTELEALYGELSTREFSLKVALSVVSLELETRQKSRRSTPLGIEEQTTSGDFRITRPSLGPSPPKNPRAWGKPVPDHLGNDPERKPRSDKGTHRESERAPDTSSCCGAEGRRMNTDSLDCAACREVVE